MGKTSVLVVGVILAVGFLFLGKNNAQEEKSMIEIDGSSTVFPITEAMAEEFQKENSNIQVVVGISGTGGGFKRFCRGETHINDASRPIKESEIELCAQNGIQYIELPVAFDGLSVMAHPSNDWVTHVTAAELKKIWEPEAQNTITRWSQIRPEWPDEKINLYGPGADSGTYDYFTEVIVGEEGASRGDFIASEDDNVLVQGIASDPLALGFFGYAYYAENKERLKLVPVTNKEHGAIQDAVLPSPETINNGSYTPLSRPIFVYASAHAAQDPAISRFIHFYLDPHNAETLVREVGYVPLPEELYALARERFQNRITGSLFEQSESRAGATLHQLLSQE